MCVYSSHTHAHVYYVVHTCSIMHVTYFFVCVQVVSTGNVMQQQGNTDGVCLCGFLSGFLSSVVPICHSTVSRCCCLCLHTHKYVLYCQLNMYTVVFKGLARHLDESAQCAYSPL